MPYADPQRARAAALERYRKNRPAARARMRAYYRANAEKRSEYVDKNREQINERNRARRARTVPTPETTMRARELLHDPCSYCDDAASQIDHIEPLSRDGKHEYRNLTAACGHCNASKGDRPLLIFLATREV